MCGDYVNFNKSSYLSYEKKALTFPQLEISTQSNSCNPKTVSSRRTGPCLVLFLAPSPTTNVMLTHTMHLINIC